MDFYLYGPKEDLYHRIQWAKPYPVEEQKTLRNLVDNEKCESAAKIRDKIKKLSS